MVAPEFLRSPGPPWVLVSVSTLPQVGEVAIAKAAVQALRRCAGSSYGRAGPRC
jgi:hypothetical protein